MDFIGRDALMKQRDEGVKRMYVQLILQDHDHDIDLWPWGGEPIYRNGKYVGAVTTTGYGFTFKKQVWCPLLYSHHAFSRELSSKISYDLLGCVAMLSCKQIQTF
jgi:pyruvate dehydrogenase phosphatase regulatory subunit